MASEAASGKTFFEVRISNMNVSFHPASRRPYRQSTSPKHWILMSHRIVAVHISPRIFAQMKTEIMWLGKQETHWTISNLSWQQKHFRCWHLLSPGTAHSSSLLEQVFAHLTSQDRLSIFGFSPIYPMNRRKHSNELVSNFFHPASTTMTWMA